MDSLFATCVEKTRTEIVAKALTGIVSDRVVQLAVPRPSDQVMKTLPAIAVAPFGAESVSPATNLSDDYGFPVLVVIVDATANQPRIGDHDARLVWRETLIDHFVHNRFAEISRHLDTIVEPQPAIDPGWWGQQLFVSSFVVRYVCRKARRAG